MNTLDMTFEFLKYGKNTLDLYRKIERNSFRSKKVEKDLKFLEICKCYGTIPDFIKFRVYCPTFQTTRTYRSWCFDLLDWEIDKQKKKIPTIKKKLEDDTTLLTSCISYFDSKCLLSLNERNMEKKLCKVDFRHNKKLTKLGIDLNKKVDKNKVIFNFSDRILSDEQKEVLSLGFDYCIPPSTIPHNQFFLCFEKLCHTIKNCEIYKDRWNHITNSISTVAHDTYKKFKCHVKGIHTPYPSLTPLIALRDDNNIVITKPDKGRGVVILNRDDYFSKLNTILSDSSKFKPIMSDTATHLLKLEDKLNRLLRSIRTSIGEMTYNLLTISGSRPGRLYGLPKIHKIGQPLRPIISAIGAFNYNLAKFLVQLITPLTTNEYTIENSFSFIKEISDLKPLRPVTMVRHIFENLLLFVLRFEEERSGQVKGSKDL
ncbi:uncharacterized protein [Penaeus vannamei]|uniref:uncharacterized protein n=1 Tax=Penaeus vannamei TaxID=6689 RepID=UPI00387F9FBE